MMLIRESLPSRNKSKSQLPNTIRRNFRRGLVDLLAALPSLRLEVHPRLRFPNSRIELRMHSALPELPRKKV